MSDVEVPDLAPLVPDHEEHRGHIARSVVQKNRSKRLTEGRGRLRLEMASCWRKARTSSEVSRRLAKKTRMAARVARTNRPQITLVTRCNARNWQATAQITNG